jgi:protein ImuA
VLPFGIKAIDQYLPDGGLALAALHDVAGGGNGAIDGAAAALFTAGIAARTRGQVLWCVTRHDLFAPAIAQAGLLPIASSTRKQTTRHPSSHALRRDRGIAGSAR